MHKSYFIIGPLLLFCTIGLFINGFRSFLVIFLIFGIGIVFWHIFRYFIEHSKLDPGYQKALSQSKKRSQASKKKNKKRKTSFKVVDGGKK